MSHSSPPRAVTGHRGRPTPLHRSRSVRVGAALLALVVVASCSASAPQNRTARGPAAAVVRPTTTTTAPTTTAPRDQLSTTPRPPAPGAAAPTTYVTPGSRPAIGGCEVYPRDHAFHATVTGLPVRADSAAVISRIGGSTPIGAGFGSTIWQGSRPGFPVNVLDSTTSAWQRLLVAGDFVAISDGEWMPWPESPRFEGWPGRAWDKHLLVVDSATCTTWEAINLQPPLENIWAGLMGRWWTDKVVNMDLSSYRHRAGGSVTASGFSMLAGLVTYDEVASGNIDHVMVIALPEIRANSVVWPAQATDGRSTHPAAPQMGSWFRLRADVDLSGLGPQARVVATALKDHGAVLADTGPAPGLAGEPDVRWNDADLAGLRRLTIDDFELVDPTPMKISDDSLRIR